MSIAVAPRFALAWVVVSAVACSKAPAEPITRAAEESRAPGTAVAPGSAQARTGMDTEGVNRSRAVAPGGAAASETQVPVSPDDPMKGVFSLEMATVGLGGSGELHATIDTSKGQIECKLFDSKAPNTVANFVGLARGLRPWKDPKGTWVKRAAFDGTKFHRVIPDFMIQGGDAKGNGSGEPGYVIADELWVGAKHDRAGLLCMANRGPNTNGAQFFITDKAAAHLDASYTIFGECAPTGIVHDIATVARDPRDMPLAEVSIRSIKIARRPVTAAPKL